MSIAEVIEFGLRCLLVLLFLPFSAADKLFNFGGAVAQAEQIAPKAAATAMIVLGLAVEVLMSLGVISGVADRLAALILGGYCMVTALLWKQFWVPGDFWRGGVGRGLFWDFCKNFSLAGGFLLLALGSHQGDFRQLLAQPLGSTHPYRAR